MTSPLISCCFIFPSESLVWSVKTTTGDAPKAMSSRGVVSGNNLLVFGGVLHGEAQDTLHSLDMSKSLVHAMVIQF